jgi:hypothetical protein
MPDGAALRSCTEMIGRDIASDAKQHRRRRFDSRRAFVLQQAYVRFLCKVARIFRARTAPPQEPHDGWVVNANNGGNRE